MTMATPLLIIGTGGNSVEIVDTVRAINAAAPSGPRYQCLGFVDDDPALWGLEMHGLPVIGPVASARDVDAHCVNGVGGPSSFWRRPSIAERAGVTPDRFETLVHPAATVSPSARIGRGSVIFPHVVIGAHADVGDHVLVLPNTVVSHDVVVGSHTCITAGVCVSSRVSIGDAAYLGTGACVRGGVRIGTRALVGMGAVVLEDVPDATVVAGNPARILRAVRLEPEHV
jgi:sugar O-acyltransferase (sialic acid O-acetyltransferase NeuD family)